MMKKNVRLTLKNKENNKVYELPTGAAPCLQVYICKSQIQAKLWLNFLMLI